MVAGEPTNESLIESVPLLRGIRGRQRQRLLASLDRIDVPAGHVVQLGGGAVRWVHFVVRGAVVEDGPHGRRWTDGSAVGVADALHRRLATATTRTAVDTTLLVVGVRELTALVAAVPTFAVALVRHVTADPPVTPSASASKRRRRFERTALAVAR